MNIILFGPPGAGKGTQAKFLVESNRYVHISTGDLIRAEIKSGSDLGQHIQSKVQEGKFPTDEVVIKLFDKALQETKKAEGRIFDGFPRTLDQAQYLLNTLHSINQSLDVVISLSLNIEKLIQRILGRYSCAVCGEIYNDYLRQPKVKNKCDKCGSDEFMRRSDDTKEAISARCNVYKEITEPILDFFKEKTYILSIDANNSADKICKLIQENISARKNLNKQHVI